MNDLPPKAPPHIATLILLASISALSMSVFLPSLSQMAAHFGVSYGLMQIAVSGYLAITALIQLIVGPLSDRFGRRPVLLAGLGLFSLASLGCIFAPNATVFLIMRMLQGSVIAAMALSRAIVRDVYDAAKAASMLAYVIMGMSIVPMIGPVIGGLIEEAYGWQGSFALLCAAGLATFAIVLFTLPETSPGKSGRPAPKGALGILTRSQRFWAYVLTAAFTSGGYFALLAGASHVADNVFFMSPRETGLALGVSAIGYLAGNGISGRFSPRFGLDRMILWGAVISAIFMTGSLCAALAGLHSPWILFGLSTALGFGSGLVLPNAMAGLLSVRPDLAGTASGIGGAAQIGSGALVASLAAIVLERGQTALPLQAIMAACALAALGTALWARHRNARKAQAPST